MSKQSTAHEQQKQRAIYHLAAKLGEGEKELTGWAPSSKAG